MLLIYVMIVFAAAGLSVVVFALGVWYSRRTTADLIVALVIGLLVLSGIASSGLSLWNPDRAPPAIPLAFHAIAYAVFLTRVGVLAWIESRTARARR